MQFLYRYKLNSKIVNTLNARIYARDFKGKSHHL